MDQSTPFYIGQYIEIFIFQYINPLKKKIHNAYFYYDKQLKELPNFIQFVKTKNKLELTVNYSKFSQFTLILIFLKKNF